MHSHLIVLNFAKFYTPSVLCPTFTPSPAHVGMPDSHHYKSRPHHGSHILTFSSSPHPGKPEGTLEGRPASPAVAATLHLSQPRSAAPTQCTIAWCGQRDRTS